MDEELIKAVKDETVIIASIKTESGREFKFRIVNDDESPAYAFGALLIQKDRNKYELTIELKNRLKNLAGAIEDVEKIHKFQFSEDVLIDTDNILAVFTNEKNLLISPELILKKTNSENNKDANYFQLLGLLEHEMGHVLIGKNEKVFDDEQINKIERRYEVFNYLNSDDFKSQVSVDDEFKTEQMKELSDFKGSVNKLINFLNKNDISVNANYSNKEFQAVYNNPKLQEEFKNLLREVADKLPNYTMGRVNTFFSKEELEAQGVTPVDLKKMQIVTNNLLKLGDNFSKYNEYLVDQNITYKKSVADYFREKALEELLTFNKLNIKDWERISTRDVADTDHPHLQERIKYNEDGSKIQQNIVDETLEKIDDAQKLFSKNGVKISNSELQEILKTGRGLFEHINYEDPNKQDEIIVKYQNINNELVTKKFNVKFSKDVEFNER